MAQEIVVGNKGAFEIVLKDDTQALEEVVVVGYAAQKKVNLTGSVASLNFTDEKLSRPVIHDRRIVVRYGGRCQCDEY